MALPDCEIKFEKVDGSHPAIARTAGPGRVSILPSDCVSLEPDGRLSGRPIGTRSLASQGETRPFVIQVERQRRGQLACKAPGIAKIKHAGDAQGADHRVI